MTLCTDTELLLPFPSTPPLWLFFPLIFLSPIKTPPTPVMRLSDLLTFTSLLRLRSP